MKSSQENPAPKCAADTAPDNTGGGDTPPSVSPSFTHSMAPSYAPSHSAPSCDPSSNAILSDIIRLDDEEEIWLKG